MSAIDQTGTVTLYISHGAGSGRADGPENVTTDWFIVEPRNDPHYLAIAVAQLRRAGRTVIELPVTPYQSRDDFRDDRA